MHAKNKKKLMALGIAMLILAAAVGLFFAVVPPPVEGFYFVRLLEPLDGSTSYIHLSDGTVYVVSSHGRGQVTWESMGTYEAANGKVRVLWSDGRLKPISFTPGWFRLKWEADAYDRLLTGESVGLDDNWRIWLSPAKITMLRDDGRPGREQENAADKPQTE